ncbi:GGDEF domain-containing protein [Sporolactobacillus kofuensis]|uniref:GGDEF domain-containing protein n=1 Tax=Sporolactobacillus kofuensis TaxID=269672 RepID=A0ABW1WDI1_9BACL|nr:GGDEF domain-containing protein [Sporolactobacillus kofuensis]MCO7175379.1 GGDEF domain-containing protein [Sporolactobacillus kofuensis]
MTFTNNIIAIFLDLLCLTLTYKGFMRVASFTWVCEVAVHSVICIWVFGWEQGYYYYLLALVPIVFFARWHISLRIIVSLLLFSTTLSLFGYSHTHPPITRISNVMTLFMYVSNATATFIGAAYAAFFYKKYSEQMEKKLSKLANTDVLTGIHNRRSFEYLVKQQLAKHFKQMKPCVFIIFDVDHFKKINDSFGHAIGDAALQKVTDICRRSLHGDDLFGRIGGEEFAVFLANTTQIEAAHIAERIRKNIEGYTMKLERGTTFDLSVSIGITIPHAKNDELSHLMKRADQALYRAKREGRNRVVSLN